MHVQNAANMSQRSEIGKYAVRWKPSTPPQNMRLWLLQGLTLNNYSTIWIYKLIKINN